MEPAEGFGEAASVEPDSAEADLAEPDLGEKAMPTAAEDAAPEVADETEMPAEAFAGTGVAATGAPHPESDDLLAVMAEPTPGAEALPEAVAVRTPPKPSAAHAADGAAAAEAATAKPRGMA